MPTHRVLSLRDLTEHTFVLRFTREGLPFTAGQHVSLRLDGTWREYSVYSGEADPWLEVLVREVVDGVVSPRLRRLAAGDNLEVAGPSGVFVLESPREPALFVATGTGIAPFHAMARTHPGLPVRVVHGVRYVDEAYDHSAFTDVVLCATRGDGTEDHTGRVTDWLREHGTDGRRVYLCGRSEMIDEAFEILMGQGDEPHRVHTEVYF